MGLISLRQTGVVASLSWDWYGSAVLFDMDGTLVDSGDSVVRAWRWVADELEQPFIRVAPFIHGIPADQVLARVAPEVSPARRAELVQAMLDRQCSDTLDVTAVPGALAALDALPTARWAVVTPATMELALARIRAAGLPLPRVLITAELTTVGKPSPEPFLAGAQRLGVEIERCLVVEDSPAGVAAGRAAGAAVLGVLTTGEGLDGVAFEISDLSEAEFEADRRGVSVRATPQSS